MKRLFIQTKRFSQQLDSLIEGGKLLIDDFENLEKELLNNPHAGDVISGLNGLRKIRLKSATKGKRGGFRIDYLDLQEVGIIMFFVLYAKNEKEDLSSEEKKLIAKKIQQFKEEAKSKYGKKI